LGWVLDDCDNSLEFFGRDFTGTAVFPIRTASVEIVGAFIPLVQVDIGLFANQVGVSSAYTLDLGQSVHDLLFAIDVGVEETENELDCLGVKCLLGRLSECFLNLQFDFSPETSAAVMLAMSIQALWPPEEPEVRGESAIDLHMLAVLDKS
jgi:hypothetical protein